MALLRLFLMVTVTLFYAYQDVIAASLKDNGNGTVTDNYTGLIWQQADGGLMTWDNAIIYCETLYIADSNDWRLPNIKELESITDDNRYDPAIDTTYFPLASSYPFRYWSSTYSTGSYSGAWTVSFERGYNYDHDVSNSFYVRCVRGRQ